MGIESEKKNENRLPEVSEQSSGGAGDGDSGDGSPERKSAHEYDLSKETLWEADSGEEATREYDLSQEDFSSTWCSSEDDEQSKIDLSRESFLEQCQEVKQGFLERTDKSDLRGQEKTGQILDSGEHLGGDSRTIGGDGSTDETVVQSRDYQELTDGERQAELGKCDVEATDDHEWDRLDGIAYHKIAEDHAVESLDDPDRGISVEKEVKAKVLDENGELAKTGSIDLLVNQKDVIDIKTDDMRGWSKEKAKSMGEKYGKQVAEYVASPDTAKDAQGHLFMVGRQPSEDARQKLQEAADRHDVSVTFLDSADPAHVTAVIQDRLLRSSHSRDRH